MEWLIEAYLPYFLLEYPESAVLLLILNIVATLTASSRVELLAFVGQPLNIEANSLVALLIELNSFVALFQPVFGLLNTPILIVAAVIHIVVALLIVSAQTVVPQDPFAIMPVAVATVAIVAVVAILAGLVLAATLIVPSDILTLVEAPKFAAPTEIVFPQMNVPIALEQPCELPHPQTSFAGVAIVLAL